MKKLSCRSSVYLILICLFLSACATRHQSPDTNSHLVNFAPLTDWEKRVFNKHTDYSIIHEGDSVTLKAVTNNSASMLYKKLRVDLNTTPYLNWQWKINSTYNDINEQTRSGDDYPARIYIAIKSKNGSIYPRALTYVWSNHSEKLSHWKNPYSDLVTMLAIESGNSLSKQWITEKRNLKQDLLNFFGEEIDSIEGIAIMSDSDNTHLSATGFYRNMFFSEK